MEKMINDYCNEAKRLEAYICKLKAEISTCGSETAKDKIRKRIALIKEELFEIRLDVSAMRRHEEG